MIGRLLCRVGWHNDWLLSITGPPAQLFFTTKCLRCGRIK